VRGFYSPLESILAKVVTVSSGFRDEVLNNALGGSKSSQHCLGMAADIEIFDVPNNELSDWIKENLMFDQLILEYFDPADGPNSGWVHVSYNPTISLNRKEYLMAIKKNGKTEYKPIMGLSTDRYVK
jgi:zinc D-Ala-D-Ala carboxypeptidase